MKICAVIMAGGAGTRLWPLSRESYPKQFLSLHGKGTLLQETIMRLNNLEIDSSLIISNEDHRFLVAEQLREINKLDTILLEPVSRNTAPTITLAAIKYLEQDPILFILPSDHIIESQIEFEKAIIEAIPLAKSGKLVTFGIAPKEPNTEYGYIKKGESLDKGFTVEKFIEKPSINEAKEYISTNDYLWNSGMFLFKASKYLEELKKFRPDILEICESSMSKIVTDPDFLKIDEKQFLKCPSESVDYAVLEKTEDAAVVQMNTAWNDIGSWSALWNLSNKDKEGNSSQGDVILHDARKSYIRSDERLTVAMGVKDLFVVDTKDALLVAHKDKVKDIKAITDKLKSDSRAESKHHREVHRPWGKYDSIDRGGNFRVKRITVRPEEKINLQIHKYRSEHWIVVSGRARVTIGDDSFFLNKNESTYISASTIHSFENPDDKKLEIIVVQSGTYLNEDDII